MFNSIIKVQNLSKIYHLYNDPIDRLKEIMHPFRKKYHHDFYALDDVSFEIKKGESVGIIGKNGAGKSTLLQILTGVLTPNSGMYFVNGKISSLLELGVGFNPELSGLENVYFNGTVLGYSKREIENKLDEILSFADIGEFIYQPVKTYSSGMYVRLGFAVAINIDPEVLIVDEALSVGDIRFQLKCFRKLREFQDAGKTILFVTHDIGAVMNYCSQAIWLDNGKLKEIGKPETVCKKYAAFMAYDAESQVQIKKEEEVIKDKDFKKKEQKIPFTEVSHCSSFGEGGAQITGVALYNPENFESFNVLKGGERVCLAVEIKSVQNIEKPIIGFYFSDVQGNNIFGSNTFLRETYVELFKKGETRIVQFLFDFPLLLNHDYAVTVAIAEGTQDNHTQHHWIHDALTIKVADSSLEAIYGSKLRLSNIDIVFN